MAALSPISFSCPTFSIGPISSADVSLASFLSLASGSPLRLSSHSFFPSLNLPLLPGSYPGFVLFHHRPQTSDSSPSRPFSPPLRLFPGPSSSLQTIPNFRFLSLVFRFVRSPMAVLCTISCPGSYSLFAICISAPFHLHYTVFSHFRRVQFPVLSLFCFRFFC